MADVTIRSSINQTLTAHGRGSPVFTSAQVGYAFFVASNSDLMYCKTADGGATWASPVTVSSGTVIAHSVRFDKWTAGGTGTMIHIWWIDSALHAVLYRTLETTEDSLGTLRTVFTGSSASAGMGNFVSGAKMRGGNLYCAFDIDAGSEKGLRRSTDGGVTWTARDTGTPIEATLDWALLFPGNEADNQDLWMLYYDDSSKALTLKVHDDSAATTSESSTISGVVPHVSYGSAPWPFSGAIRHSDGHLIVALMTASFDDATHRVFDINGIGSITEKTAIATLVDRHEFPAVYIHQGTNNIYVGYIGKRDGSEDQGTWRPYYVKSTDGGTTWSAGDTAYGQLSGSYRQLSAPQTGDRFLLTWNTVAGTADYRTNFVNSLDLSQEGVLSGIAAMSFTSSALLTGKAALSGATAFSFSAEVKSAGPIAGVAVLAFESSPQVELRDATPLVVPVLEPRTTPTAERAVLVAIDQPVCQLTYSVSPCEAVLGETGTRRCFNTRATCQDPAHYTPNASLDADIPNLGGATFEGFGALTTGGSAKPFSHVVTTNDTGPGSLRDALSQGNRHIVFDVAGTIALESPLAISGLTKITVDGFTAPSPGITVTGHKLEISDSSDVVVRGMRLRNSATSGIVIHNCANFVIDHVSVSGFVERAIDVANGSHDGSLQWCIFGAGVAADGGAHNPIRDGCFKVTVHHCLYERGADFHPRVTTIPAGGTAIPTFHSISLYWVPPSVPSGNAVRVRYRKATDVDWKTGHDLFYDSRIGRRGFAEARGSLVHLDPGSAYVIQLGMPSGTLTNWVTQLTASTWPETFPTGVITSLVNGTRTTPLVLTSADSGTASAYKVWTFPVGGATTIDVAKAHDFCITVAASFVIIRGLTLRGARKDGIRFLQGAHHIVIEDCDISDWGTASGSTTSDGWVLGQPQQSAIGMVANPTWGPTVRNLVIQRNKIHDPTYGSSSWDDGHPNGPAGIIFWESGGQNVIRYNEFYSSSDSRRFNDCMGQEGNFGYKGFPGPDSDIYKNKFENFWDDAFECEGDGMNIRIWKNYIDNAGAAGMGLSPVQIGPVYVWRNVMNRGRSHFRQDWDNTGYGAFKLENIPPNGGGRTYIYHNTLLQFVLGGESFPIGAKSGVWHVGGGGNVVTRNNILHIKKPNWTALFGGSSSLNSFNYDMIHGDISTLPAGSEANGLKPAVVPIYKAGHGPTALGTGLYELDTGSPGLNAGVLIPNFNDDFLGAAPDIGAHENGSAQMVFGALATGH